MACSAAALAAGFGLGYWAFGGAGVPDESAAAGRAAAEASARADSAQARYDSAAARWAVREAELERASERQRVRRDSAARRASAAVARFDSAAAAAPEPPGSGVVAAARAALAAKDSVIAAQAGRIHVLSVRAASLDSLWMRAREGWDAERAANSALREQVRALNASLHHARARTTAWKIGAGAAAVGAFVAGWKAS